MNVVFSLCKCILDFVLFWWLADTFFTQRYKSYIQNALVLCSLAVCQFLVNGYMNAAINALAAFSCSIIMVMVLFMGIWWQRILCAIASTAIGITCEFIPISFLSIPSGQAIEDTMDRTIHHAGFNLIGSAILAIIIMLLQYYIRKKRKNQSTFTLSTNGFVLCLPIISVLVLYYILNTSQYIRGNRTMTFFVIVIYFGLLLSNVLIVTGEANVAKRNELQRQLIEMAAKEDLQNKLLEQQEIHLKALSGMAHDFKRELAGLRLIGDGEQSYLYREQMMDFIQEIDVYRCIETKPLQVILYELNAKCLAANVHFDADIRYGDFNFMSYPAIYSLFDNLLENAYEACISMPKTAGKFIYLKTVRQNHIIYIEVKNSFSGRIKSANGILKTTKPDGKKHGIGTSNARKIVQQYNGSILFEFTTDTFISRITLPLPGELAF